MARQGALPSSVSVRISLTEMRKRLPARHPDISQCPGSLAVVLVPLRPRASAEPLGAGPRFAFRRCLLPLVSCRSLAPCG